MKGKNSGWVWIGLIAVLALLYYFNSDTFKIGSVVPSPTDYTFQYAGYSWRCSGGIDANNGGGVIDSDLSDGTIQVQHTFTQGAYQCNSLATVSVSGRQLRISTSAKKSSRAGEGCAAYIKCVPTNFSLTSIERIQFIGSSSMSAIGSGNGKSTINRAGLTHILNTGGNPVVLNKQFADFTIQKSTDSRFIVFDFDNQVAQSNTGFELSASGDVYGNAATATSEIIISDYIIVGSLQGQIDTLTMTLAEKLVYITNLNTTITQKQALIDTLQLSLADKLAYINSLNQDLIKQAEAITLLESERVKQGELIAKLQLTLEQESQMVKTLSAKATEQAQIIAGMQLNIQEQAAMITSLTVKASEQAAMINTLTTNLAVKAELINKLTAENDKQAELIAAMRESFTNQGIILDSLNLTVQQDAQIITKLTTNNQEQAAIISGMQLKAQEQAQLITTLTANLEQQKTIILNLKSSNAEKELVIKQLNQSVEYQLKLLEEVKKANTQLIGTCDPFVSKLPTYLGMLPTCQSGYLIIILGIVGAVGIIFMLGKRK